MEDHSILTVTNFEELDNQEIKDIKQELEFLGVKENEIIFCEKCFVHSLIQFISFSEFQCKCGKKVDIIEDNNNYNFMCKKHHTQFKFYCNACEENLCDECINIHKHKNPNDFYSFEKHQKEMIENIKYIINIIKPEKPNNFENKNKDEKSLKNLNIIRLITTLIREYIDNPNYAIIESINNFIKYNDKAKNNEKRNSHLSDLIIINSESKYIDKKSYNDKIVEIKIVKKHFDINLLKGIFNNLEILDLSYNCIKSLEAITQITFINLKNLNLSYNLLSDNDIKIIKELKIKNLNQLNLENNKFSDYEIFAAIVHFNNLKVLNLNSNLFKLRENDNDNKIVNYNFKLIECLYLSNGVFSEESIVIMFEKFELKNLKILNVSGNNLKSLSFFKYLEKFSSLETLYLNNNEIDDSGFCFDKLVSNKNLKNIYVEYNLLTKEEYILKAKEKNINLKILGNNIDFNKLIGKTLDGNEIF